MRKSSTRAKEEEGAIDLTPMLDVVFIMLIFFIVTASFIKQTGIDVNRPDATTASKKNPGILVAINPNGEVWIDKNRVDPRMIKSIITKMRADNPEGSLVIQADAEATAEVIIKVMDAARSAGVSDVSLSTEG